MEPYSSLERASTSPDDNNLRCKEGEGGREEGKIEVICRKRGRERKGENE